MRIRIRSSFIVKAVAAAGLVALGDWLFWQHQGVGSNLGAFAIVWALVTIFTRPATWRNRSALAAAVGALAMGASLCWNPSLLGVALFWALLSASALLPRFAGFDHVGRWVLRLLVHGASSAFGPWIDLSRLRATRKRGGTDQRISAGRLLALLPLPLIGGAVFVGLFAAANPVISDALMRLSTPEFHILTVVRWIIWGVLLVTVWATLRPRRTMLPFGDYTSTAIPALPGVTVGSVTLALITFNALFALQNGLDLVFLWSGAPLPQGVTPAQYAHQGAYPLIATALLAGLFVLVCLRPGSDTAKVPLIRWLVILWVVQNVFLVASSILRTMDYIEVFSLTRLRIAALIWMALVAVGLVLILWRMLRGKSAAWLINANALAAGLVLAACSVVDLGSVAASWNVQHAKEVGGKGAMLDLCYLHELGPSAYVSLVELEQRDDLAPGFRNRVAWVRLKIGEQIDRMQADGDWIWRNDQRVDQARAILNGRKLSRPAIGPTGRECDGSISPPPTPDPDFSTETDAPALTNEVEQ